MRIVSQGGMYDLPYEETTFRFFHDGRIVAYALSDPTSDNYIVMAEYSSGEKANKAMEMCREKYLSRTVNGYYVQPNYLALPKVFQFPADNEI